MKSRLLSEIDIFDHTLRKKSLRTYKRIVCKLCEDHPDQAWSVPIPGFLRSGDIPKLLDYADFLVSQTYDTAKDTFLANQIASLVKKYPFPKQLSLTDPDAKARETWIDDEQKCSFVNSRFVHPFWGGFWKQYSRMQAFIRYAIKDQVPFSRIYDRCDIGPGASIGCHGKATNLARKFGGVWSVTPGARNYAWAAFTHNFQLMELLRQPGENVLCLDIETLRKRFDARLSVIPHNKITFVPKTVKTSRSIAVEPLFNSFVQKGTDLVLRDFLKRLGIDLSDQSVNSRMARSGSIDHSPEGFVTIDLKSASDSISTNLCRQLLPPDWFDFLNSIRSKEYELDRTRYEYQKFCSMGNGFCFPLETLLFTAACHAVGAGVPSVDFHVYGDDIVLRQKHAADLIALLNDMGFEVNLSKSYLEGNFRESCGSDWYSGSDIRPVTLDFRLESLQSLFKLWNLSTRNSRTFDFFSGARDIIWSLIPESLRFSRPVAGNEDSAMTVERDKFMSSPFAWWSKDYQAWGWTEIISLPTPDKGWKRHEKSSTLLLLAALRGSSSRMPFTMRRMTHKAIRKVAYSPNLERFGGGVTIF